MKRFMAFVSFLLVLVLTFAPLTTSGYFLTGDDFANYTVTDSETHVLGDGLSYNEFSYTDANGIGQTCFVMEFNPKSSDFRPYVYHSKASHGYTIAEDAENAYNEGLEVYAAINGDFFSMDANNYGTAIGFYGTEGAVVSAYANFQGNALVFNEDGTGDVVPSYLGFTVNIGGTDYSNQLRYINKRTIGDENGIYYFDGAIGSASPIAATASRTELVCDITSTVTDLQIGETLTATVSQINTNGGSAFKAGEQIVLSSNLSLDLSAVKVGDTVSITTTERVESSREVMENASHFIYARYVLVHDGVKQTINDPGMADIFAQRCVVGIKADGTLVYMVSDGRKVKGNGANGLNFTQILEIMEQYGCEEVVNLDGGGSTAVILSEGDGKFNYEFIGEGTGRPVANSVLIVRDPNAKAPAEPTYKPIVDDPAEELRNVAINKDYSVEYNGIMEPTYLSGVCGDAYELKITNGRYRTAEDIADRHSTVYVGAKSNITYKFDLEKSEKLRSITLRNIILGNFKVDNVIIYTSDDGMNWSQSVDYDMTAKRGAISTLKNITCTFKEEHIARYVKLVIGTPANTLTIDEVEINAMVNKSLPVEEPAPEDPRTLPADTPSEGCTNVALLKKYTITCDGMQINPVGGELPRYYGTAYEEQDRQLLTNGMIGAVGNFNDGATLAIYAGANTELEILLDLGAVYDDLEFVQLLNMINNGASFGHINTATVSVSTDGAEYKAVGIRENLTVKTGTQYYSLTMQFLENQSARYISVKVKTEKALFGLAELTVLQAPQYTYGDVDMNGTINAADASLVLQYNVKLKELSEAQKKAADVNADGKINAADASLILQYNVQLIQKFPADK